MHLVRHAIPRPAGATLVAVAADRLTLSKTRWRGVAADGTEFGFDLAHPLQHGDCVFAEAGRAYCIEQASESVLEIALRGSHESAAQLGWLMGNLHQVVQVEPGLLRVADDPAARQMLEQQRIPFVARQAVFSPFRASAGHHHSHHAH